ncbi:MAG: type II secretion system protein [Planctomycetes bacterium]|nr:type II secretion system protein [Planctomycetota bacterium]
MGLGVRTGFTLTELLIVITVIAALMALGLPSYFSMGKQARIGGSKTLVMAVQNAIASYSEKVWRVVERNPSASAFGQLRRIDVQLWDLNDDSVIDGDPALDTAVAFPVDIHDPVNPSRTTYHGFYDMVGMPLPSRSGVNDQRQVVDAWKQPLRIGFGATYGTRQVGVWSCGPDLKTGTTDDICSWK